MDNNRQQHNYYPPRPLSSKNAPDKFLQNFDEDDDDIDDLNYDELIDNFDDFNQMGTPNFSSFPNPPTKKRKFNNLPNYQFVPRLSRNNNSINNSNSFGNSYDNDSNLWSEQETFSLLEAWGNKYLGGGRKSLRSDDWNEVAERVSDVSLVERSDSECRNRLDTLKKKYKKERARMEEDGGGAGGSNWIYFKRMDMLLGDRSKGEYGLACGVDSGEYVFMNPSVYLNCSNGFDEMRDSPGEEEDEQEDETEDEEEQESERGESYRMLVDSVNGFGQIYEKIEKSKRQQMVELEKMRMDFQRDMELQKKKMMDKVQAEIGKIGDNAENGGEDDDNDDTDGSAENLSG